MISQWMRQFFSEREWSFKKRTTMVVNVNKLSFKFNFSKHRLNLNMYLMYF